MTIQSISDYPNYAKNVSKSRSFNLKSIRNIFIKYKTKILTKNT